MGQFINTAIIFMSLPILLGTAYAKNVAVNKVVPQTTQWSGLYGGINLGGIFNKVDLHSNHLGFINPEGTCNTSAYFSSFFPGVQLGYAHQFNAKWMFGVEGDFTYNLNQQENIKCVCKTNVALSDQFSFKNQMQASFRGRMGYVLNNGLLPFFVAGASVADLGISYRNEVNNFYSKNSSQTGWLVGAGLEWNVFQNWSVRAEYFYQDYGHALDMNIPVVYDLLDPNGGAYSNLQANNVKLAINYWFF